MARRVIKPLSCQLNVATRSGRIMVQQHRRMLVLRRYWTGSSVGLGLLMLAVLMAKAGGYYN